MRAHLKSILSVLGILVAGIVATVMLVALRPEPPREARPVQAPLVQTRPLEAQSGALPVYGTGTVEPTREINLAAEVSGRIVAVAPSLVTGGAFRAGDVLATIDPADYENAVEIAEAQVTQRQVEVLQAQQEVALARDEWDRLRSHTGEAEAPDSTELGRLVYREPQLRTAEAALRSADAQLEDARTRLERTRVRAPFSGRVRTKAVDLGQYVAPGQAVASVYATAEVEIAVPLSSREADLIDGLWTRGRARMPATVTRDTDGAAWEGYVHRVDGAMDAATRQIQVIVRVPRPYAATEKRAPLLVGTFAQVALPGRALDRYFEVPRVAVRDSDTGAQVWIVEDGLLAMHPVTVVQDVEDRVVVTAPALPDRAALIVSDLAVVTEGLPVRTAGS
ncbi:MAG: efflux RND transporter periplasmic adaptor subunit [Bacteroidota bacterium]